MAYYKVAVDYKFDFFVINYTVQKYNNIKYLFVDSINYTYIFNSNVYKACLYSY